MLKRKQIGPALQAPDGSPIPLSAAMEAGNLVFVSGQLAIRDGRIEGENTTEQTNLVLDSIEGILAVAGLGLEHVVRTGVWLKNADDYAAFNAVYARRFPPPFPARAVVICDLAFPQALVEIEAIAMRPE